MSMLKDKTILVTGVGAGMGKSVVENALNEGANVVMGDMDEATLLDIRK